MAAILDFIYIYVNRSMQNTEVNNLRIDAPTIERMLLVIKSKLAAVLDFSVFPDII